MGNNGNFSLSRPEGAHPGGVPPPRRRGRDGPPARGDPRETARRRAEKIVQSRRVRPANLRGGI